MARIGEILTINRNPGSFDMVNNMQNKGKITGKSAKLMMRPAGPSKINPPKRKAARKVKK